MDNYAVKITNLSKKIKNKDILSDINLKIKYGDICGIIGLNGSGKSVLFKTISGLMLPTCGKIEVFQQVIGKDISFPTEFGALIEQPGFLDEYSGFRNLKMLASIKNKISDDNIKEAMKLVGINSDDKKPVKKYSLGMKQRLGIAQAIMENPKLLILDEPMNGLDKNGVVQIRNLLKDLNKNGVTIIMASHNADDIKELCNIVYEIDNGKLSKVI